MNKIFATFAFTLLACSASAADALHHASQDPVASHLQTSTWTGFTLGIQGGYGWNSSDINLAALPTVSQDFDSGILGGFVGYNYELGNNWVVGIEADFEKNWADQSAFGGNLDYGIDWQGSVRGRVGHAFDRALIYGTAGWAYARGHEDITGLGEQKETLSGYTVGAGVDYAFSDMIFGRIEYRYTDFGDKDFDFGSPTIVNTDVDQHAVRVGLGVKF